MAMLVCAAQRGVRKPNRPRVCVENTAIVNMHSQTIDIARM